MVDLLGCPVCGLGLHAADRSLRCDDGHVFDIARGGHISLLDGRSGALRSDSAEMVVARDRVHAAGFFDPVVDVVAELATSLVPPGGPVILDAGAGGGHYLRAVLRAVDTRSAAGEVARGIGLDLSRPGVRAIARGEPRAAAVVADVWRRLPVVSDAVDLVLSVFSPRNSAEFARVLRGGGNVLVVTPEPEHLAEIIEPMGMLGVDADKTDRLRTSLSGFKMADRRTISRRVSADADLVTDLVAMGPSAFHHDAGDIRARALELTAAGPIDVTLAVTVSVWRRVQPDTER